MDELTKRSIIGLNGELNLQGERLTWEQKKADDFKWVERRCDALKTIYSPFTDRKRLRRLQMNYDLANGIGEQYIADFFDVDKQILEEAGINSTYQGVHHYGVIDQVIKAEVGEQEKRLLSPTAVDLSIDAFNMRKKKSLELQQAHIQRTIIDRIQKQEWMRYQMDMGIKDPHSLSPEDQQQMQSDIQQRVEFRTPDDIFEYMSKKYKTPSETQAQHLVNWLMGELDIKFYTDQGFKHGLITDEEVYRVGIRHNKPFFELVNVMGFNHIARPNSFFIEKGIAAMYEQYVYLEDIYEWHGNEIEVNKGARELLQKYTYQSQSEGFMDMVARLNPDLIRQSPDIRTKEGQEYNQNLRNAAGVFRRNRPVGSIKYTHYNYKALRLMQNVYRIDKYTGEMINFWVDENYVSEKSKGDYKVEKAWTPEAWSAIEIGEHGEGVFIGKEADPHQYKSLRNPYEVNLSYVGAVYSKLMGNTESRSPVDNAKMLQYEYNVYKSKLRELEATDFGKVMVYDHSMLPKDWDVNKTMTVAKYGKMVFVDPNREGASRDTNVFKGIDLSNLNDIVGRIQYSDHTYDKIARAMSYNSSRMGEISPYMTVANNKDNINASVNQTEDRFSLHNKISENLLNVLMNITRVALKDNDALKNVILSDMGIAELELDTEMLERSEIAIKVRNSSEDWDNLNIAKNLLQPMIQTGMIGASDAIRLIWSKNGAEVLNIADKADAKAQAQLEASRKQEMEQIQEKMTLMIQAQRDKQAFEMTKLEKTLDEKLHGSIIESQRDANANDINLNHISDKWEIAMEQLLENSRQFNENLKLEYAKLGQTIDMSEKENEIKKLEIEVNKIKARRAGSSK